VLKSGNIQRRRTTVVIGVLVTVSSLLGLFIAKTPARQPTATLDFSVGSISRAILVREADVVFWGTVTAKGESVTVSPRSAEDPGLEARPVYLSVERYVRGDRGFSVELLTFDGESTDPFVVGERYLVFGADTELGSARVPATVPLGYYQGVFEPTTPGRVSNARFGDTDAAVLENDVLSSSP
jgi:hypothetical protein